MKLNDRAENIDRKRVKHLLKIGIFAALMVPSAGNGHISHFLFCGSYCPDQSICQRTYTTSEMVPNIQYSVRNYMDSYHETYWGSRDNKCPGCSMDQRRKSMDDGRIIGSMFKTPLNTGDKLCC